ncbi:hypothetical protein [Pseudonocardia sp.]|uniref:hypothetical protein n=1 Tax=Pseudonocardia sp. TaxID=60912 RepID=UPI00262CB6A6|nr:hypothetical protein [Pseudonocardia sp.]
MPTDTIRYLLDQTVPGVQRRREPILTLCSVVRGSSFPWMGVVMLPACWFCRWLSPLVVAGCKANR